MNSKHDFMDDQGEDITAAPSRDGITDVPDSDGITDVPKNDEITGAPNDGSSVFSSSKDDVSDTNDVDGLDSVGRANEVAGGADTPGGSDSPAGENATPTRNGQELNDVHGNDNGNASPDGGKGGSSTTESTTSGAANGAEGGTAAGGANAAGSAGTAGAAGGLKGFAAGAAALPGKVATKIANKMGIPTKAVSIFLAAAVGLTSLTAINGSSPNGGNVVPFDDGVKTEDLANHVNTQMQYYGDVGEINKINAAHAIYNYFKALGYTDEAIAGILSNIEAESGLRSDYYTGEEISLYSSEMNLKDFGEEEGTLAKARDAMFTYYGKDWYKYMLGMYDVYTIGKMERRNGDLVVHQDQHDPYYNSSESKGLLTYTRASYEAERDMDLKNSAYYNVREDGDIVSAMPGFGLFQFAGDRANDYLLYANSQSRVVDYNFDYINDNWTSVPMQIAYLYFENKEMEPGVRVNDWGTTDYYKGVRNNGTEGDPKPEDTDYRLAADCFDTIIGHENDPVHDVGSIKGTNPYWDIDNWRICHCVYSRTATGDIVFEYLTIVPEETITTDWRTDNDNCDLTTLDGVTNHKKQELNMTMKYKTMIYTVCLPASKIEPEHNKQEPTDGSSDYFVNSPTLMGVCEVFRTLNTKQAIRWMKGGKISVSELPAASTVSAEARSALDGAAMFGDSFTEYDDFTKKDELAADTPNEYDTEFYDLNNLSASLIDPNGSKGEFKTTGHWVWDCEDEDIGGGITYSGEDGYPEVELPKTNGEYYYKKIDDAYDKWQKAVGTFNTYVDGNNNLKRAVGRYAYAKQLKEKQDYLYGKINGSGWPYLEKWEKSTDNWVWWDWSAWGSGRPWVCTSHYEQYRYNSDYNLDAIYYGLTDLQSALNKTWTDDLTSTTYGVSNVSYDPTDATLEPDKIFGSFSHSDVDNWFTVSRKDGCIYDYDHPSYFVKDGYVFLNFYKDMNVSGSGAEGQLPQGLADNEFIDYLRCYNSRDDINNWYDLKQRLLTYLASGDGNTNASAVAAGGQQEYSNSGNDAPFVIDPYYGHGYSYFDHSHWKTDCDAYAEYTDQHVRDKYDEAVKARQEYVDLLAEYQSSQALAEFNTNRGYYRRDTNGNMSVTGDVYRDIDYKASFVDENTQRAIFSYLEGLGLNHAAATGIVVNLAVESGLNPHAGAGAAGYGLMQWTGSSYYAFTNWCDRNGFENKYDTLDAQLQYIGEEVLNMGTLRNDLMNVEDSRQGAGDAARLFCAAVERPWYYLEDSQYSGDPSNAQPDYVYVDPSTGERYTIHSDGVAKRRRHGDHDAAGNLAVGQYTTDENGASVADGAVFNELGRGVDADGTWVKYDLGNGHSFTEHISASGYSYTTYDMGYVVDSQGETNVQFPGQAEQVSANYVTYVNPSDMTKSYTVYTEKITDADGNVSDGRIYTLINTGAAEDIASAAVSGYDAGGQPTGWGGYDWYPQFGLVKHADWETGWSEDMCRGIRAVNPSVWGLDFYAYDLKAAYNDGGGRLYDALAEFGKSIDGKDGGLGFYSDHSLFNRDDYKGADTLRNASNELHLERGFDTYWYIRPEDTFTSASSSSSTGISLASGANSWFTAADGDPTTAVTSISVWRPSSSDDKIEKYERYNHRYQLYWDESADPDSIDYSYNPADYTTPENVIQSKGIDGELGTSDDFTYVVFKTNSASDNKPRTNGYVGYLLNAAYKFEYLMSYNYRDANIYQDGEDIAFHSAIYFYEHYLDYDDVGGHIEDPYSVIKHSSTGDYAQTSFIQHVVKSRYWYNMIVVYNWNKECDTDMQQSCLNEMKLYAPVLDDSNSNDIGIVACSDGDVPRDIMNGATKLDGKDLRENFNLTELSGWKTDDARQKYNYNGYVFDNSSLAKTAISLSYAYGHNGYAVDDGTSIGKAWFYSPYLKRYDISGINWEDYDVSTNSPDKLCPLARRCTRMFIAVKTITDMYDRHVAYELKEFSEQAGNAAIQNGGAMSVSDRIAQHLLDKLIEDNAGYGADSGYSQEGFRTNNFNEEYSVLATIVHAAGYDDDFPSNVNLIKRYLGIYDEHQTESTSIESRNILGNYDAIMKRIGLEGRVNNGVSDGEESEEDAAETAVSRRYIINEYEEDNDIMTRRWSFWDLMHKSYNETYVEDFSTRLDRIRSLLSLLPGGTPTESEQDDRAPGANKWHAVGLLSFAEPGVTYTDNHHSELKDIPQVDGQPIDINTVSYRQLRPGDICISDDNMFIFVGQDASLKYADYEEFTNLPYAICYSDLSYRTREEEYCEQNGITDLSWCTTQNGADTLSNALSAPDGGKYRASSDGTGVVCRVLAKDPEYTGSGNVNRQYKLDKVNTRSNGLIPYLTLLLRQADKNNNNRLDAGDSPYMIFRCDDIDPDSSVYYKLLSRIDLRSYQDGRADTDILWSGGTVPGMFTEFKGREDIQEAIIRSFYEYICNNRNNRFDSDANAKRLATAYLRYAYGSLNGSDVTDPDE